MLYEKVVPYNGAIRLRVIHPEDDKINGEVYKGLSGWAYIHQGQYSINTFTSRWTIEEAVEALEKVLEIRRERFLERQQQGEAEIDAFIEKHKGVEDAEHADSE